VSTDPSKDLHKALEELKTQAGIKKPEPVKDLHASIEKLKSDTSDLQAKVSGGVSRGKRRKHTTTKAKTQPSVPSTEPIPITSSTKTVVVKDLTKELNQLKNDANRLQSQIGQTKKQQTELKNTIKQIEATRIQLQTKRQTIKNIKETAEKIKKIRDEVIEKAGKITGAKTSKEEKSRYAKQVDSQVDFMAQLIAADVVDKKQAEKLIKELTPVAAGSVTTEDHAEKFMKKVENKLKYYENLADYKQDIGIKELTGPNKKENINKVKARFAHITMSAAIGTVLAVPTTALAVAGSPAVGGFIAAASVATLANPENRAQLGEFIEQHPQEFIYGLLGSVLGGVAVSEASKAFKLHTKNMKLKDRRALEKQWDKLIDDYAYMEQRKGAEFPSRAIEIPEPYGNQIIVSDPLDPEAQILRNFIQNVAERNEPQAIQDFFKTMKNSDMALYYDAGGGKLDTMTIPELLNKYPGLKEPYFNPTLDPNILGKADIVARSGVPGVNFTPLLGAALAEAARKGYLTDEDIKRLIKQNAKLIEQLKEQGVQIPKNFLKLGELSFTEIAEIVEQAPEETPTQIPDITQTSIQEQEPEEIVIPVPEPPGTTPETPLDTSEPLDPTPPLRLSAADQKKRREMNLSFFMGSKAVYVVTYGYPRGKGDSVTVEARSLPDAMNTAQRVKSPTRYLPNFVDIKLLKGKR